LLTGFQGPPWEGYLKGWGLLAAPQGWETISKSDRRKGEKEYRFSKRIWEKGDLRRQEKHPWFRPKRREKQSADDCI